MAQEQAQAPEWHEALPQVAGEVGRKLRAARTALEAVSKLLDDSEDRAEYFTAAQSQELQAQAAYVEDLATTVKRKI